MSAGIGNAIELYDWLAFAAFSSYFADRIFPPGNESLALLAVFASFAVSFFLRPLGGLIIGRFADRRGRKAAMILTVSMMAGGSWVIAALPPYSAVGVMAPVGLLAARIAQGLAVGGETSGAASYVLEVAPANRRGRYGAAFYVSTGVASLLAALTGVAVTTLLDEAQMSDWGWRIPFVVGGLLGLATLILRRGMSESAAHIAARDKDGGGAGGQARQHLREGALVLGVCAGGSLAYYTVFSALSPVLIANHGAVAREAFIALTLGTVVYTLCLYPFGMLSDAIGRPAQLTVFSVSAPVMLVGGYLLSGPELGRMVGLFVGPGSS